jgi:predicted TIM-barrel fold metal-dependent hydrolase
MPGIDTLTLLGAAPWTSADAAGLQKAAARARYDLAAVASRRALAGDLAGGNAETKALLDASPAMRGWLVINPVYPERSNEEMRRHAAGSKWFGAYVHPGMCGESLASRSTREMLNAYRRYTKPLLVDVPDEHAVLQLEALASEFTGLKILVAGAGGEGWQSAILAAKRCVNLFLEPFSGGSHQGKLEAMVEALGPHRVLFASHYPERNPGSALGLLMDSKLSDGEKQAVFSGNATRLFGLGRQAEPQE